MNEAPDPSLPPEPLALTEASSQEIQLELIRRRRFNQFDGPRIVSSLRRHRTLWHAVLMDRLGFISQEGLSSGGLIKLRDLPHNQWNVDDLYILTPTLEAAHQLVNIAEQERWEADNTQIMENQEELASALGQGPPDAYVISFWWD